MSQLREKLVMIQSDLMHLKKMYSIENYCMTEIIERLGEVDIEKMIIEGQLQIPITSPIVSMYLSDLNEQDAESLNAINDSLNALCEDLGLSFYIHSKAFCREEAIKKSSFPYWIDISLAVIEEEEINPQRFMGVGYENSIFRVPENKEEVDVVLKSNWQFIKFPEN